MPDFVDHLAWGPAGSRENNFLYASYEAFDSTAIYLATAGGSAPGQALVTFDATSFVHFILGLAWLPDGSGFVYSVLEDDFYTPVSANIYLYEFASGQSTPLTSFDDAFAGMLSVSPDGQEIVYEYGSAWSDSSLRVENPQLWVMGRDGANARLLLPSGRAPAWSPQAQGTPDPPPVLGEWMFLPLVVD
jgi:Tol biopolymer transport system component